MYEAGSYTLECLNFQAMAITVARGNGHDNSQFLRSSIVQLRILPDTQP